MFVRKKIYGLMMIGAMLLAGCTQDDVTADVPPTTLVPISFDCSVINDDAPTTRSAIGYTGVIYNENKELKYTGFGVFASHASGTIPDLMYNQEVEFVFQSSVTGYWTYSPVKYWPANPIGTCFYAYAPYVPTPTSSPEDLLDDGNTGIIGMSSNSGTSPFVFYARANHPEENVDLLWCFKQISESDNSDDGILEETDDGKLRPKGNTALDMTFNHALTRMKVSLGITNGTSLPVGSKLLVKRVTFTGNFAKTGQLNLASAETTPTWGNQDVVSTSETIFIDCNPNRDVASSASYGIIAEGVRYIDNLPVSWQPAGLPHVNYDSTNATTKAATSTNLLCMGDVPSYIYLIPQSDLSFTCVIDYCIIDSEGNLVDYHKTTESASISIPTLNGNTTYDLTLTITIPTI